MYSDLKDLGIENVVIFISDAHRFDHLGERIRSMGTTFKMIAPSTFTAPSLTSLSTGLFPFRHGVSSFHKTIPPEYFNLLNIPGYDSTLWTENTWVDWDCVKTTPIYRILRQKKTTSLYDLKEPFIFIEDEKGGHCPYAWTEESPYKEGDCTTAFKHLGKLPIFEMRDQYGKALERSYNEFEKRMDILKERDLLDSTLVIFLGDHGELLGEYGGLVAHGSITVPEIVQVPCVFIHPGIKKGVTHENEGLLSHVDLVPTLNDILSLGIKQGFDGINLLNTDKLPKYRYSYFQLEVNKKVGPIEVPFNMIERSIWSNNGGFVFRGGENYIKRSLRALYEMYLSGSVQSHFFRSRILKFPFCQIKNFPESFSELTNSKIRYGEPGIDEKEAREMVDSIESSKIVPDEKFRIKKTLSGINLSKLKI